MLRFIFLLAALSLASVATAARLNADSSWDEIRAARDIDVRIPEIAFQSGERTYSIPVTDVCLADENTFRTKEKVALRSRPTSGRVDNSVSMGNDFLFTDRTFTQRRCVADGRNCTWKTETVETGLEYNIPVKEKSSRGVGRTLFRKPYTITACS
ncbi:MAG: hypothetical protein JSU95_15500 [Betaproteobacteria bacterium]|nr:MAG: hypothetical protein JSU95_15500 [Betaproteobacteria bacterium]